MGDTCPDCGEEFERLNQHLALSDCEGEGSKVTLECAECGTEFEEYRYRVESDRDRDGTKFCSKACHNASMRAGNSVPCDWCGEQTYKSPSQLENNDHHFCSQECENRWRADRMSGEGAPWWDGGKEVVECEYCGSEYKVTPALVNVTRFCSRECQVDAIRPSAEETPDPEFETKVCANCGKEITRRSHHFRGEVAVCSEDCFSDWMSEKRRGEKNPAWKGGKTVVDRVRAALGETSWEKIAADQREHANHECEICGTSPNGRKLAVHHIIPVASGGTNGDWNLMALCSECHQRVENKTRKITAPHLFQPVAE
ncbi:HNH endonuclease [Halorientalis persicus]|uniref:HNH endonuclease n=1 Tax=Halorientalis persicus TaxID=1367881 RepID=A0A1H8RX42_9EURY|nr:HNH endonuclease signature motif containing protein [Halorientalis persicus]SEO70950.1 HNH endonuclease [Halorientalis persicus]